MLVYILALFGAVAGTSGQTKFDGKDWRSWKEDQKLFYLCGYLDGQGEGLSTFEASLVRANLERGMSQADIVTNVKAAKPTRKLWPTGLPTADVRDGLSQFYQDAANRNISLPDAIWILAAKVDGAPNLEEMILGVRRLATNLKALEH